MRVHPGLAEQPNRSVVKLIKRMKVEARVEICNQNSQSQLFNLFTLSLNSALAYDATRVFCHGECW